LCLVRLTISPLVLSPSISLGSEKGSLIRVRTIALMAGKRILSRIDVSNNMVTIGNKQGTGRGLCPIPLWTPMDIAREWKPDLILGSEI